MSSLSLFGTFTGAAFVLACGIAFFCARAESQTATPSPPVAQTLTTQPESGLVRWIRRCPQGSIEVTDSKGGDTCTIAAPLTTGTISVLALTTKPDVGNVPEIARALLAISPDRGRLGTSITFWGDGSVMVSVALPDSTSVRGSSTTLDAALADLESRMRALSTSSASGAENVRAILNQGRSSQ